MHFTGCSSCCSKPRPCFNSYLNKNMSKILPTFVGSPEKCSREKLPVGNLPRLTKKLTPENDLLENHSPENVIS